MRQKQGHTVCALALMAVTVLLGFCDALREWLVGQNQGRTKPYDQGCCSSVCPFATCRSSQNRCCCLVFIVVVTNPFPPCGNVFVVVVVYFILFVFLTLSNVLSYVASCVTCGQARSA